MEFVVNFCQFFERVAVPQFTTHVLIWLPLANIVFSLLWHNHQQQLWFIPCVTALTAFGLYSLFATMSCDPGTIAPQPHDPEIAEIVNALRARGHLQSWQTISRPAGGVNDPSVPAGVAAREKYCLSCNLWRPNRSGHCRVCDHCVHRFDHHCPWTGCCIGVSNTGYFFSFLTAIELLALTTLSCSVYSIFVQDSLPLWSRLLLSVNVIALVLVSFGVTMLYYQTVSAIARDLTSRELTKNPALAYTRGANLRTLIQTLRFLYRQPYKRKTTTAASPTVMVNGASIDKAQLKPGTAVPFQDSSGAPMEIVTFTMKEVQAAIAAAGVVYDADGKPKLGSNTASLEALVARIAPTPLDSPV